jgi:hypothetical protein
VRRARGRECGVGSLIGRHPFKPSGLFRTTVSGQAPSSGGSKTVAVLARSRLTSNATTHATRRLWSFVQVRLTTRRDGIACEKL